MTPYKNLGGNSNVVAFEVGAGYIDVQFGDGSIYRYSIQSAGAENVVQMKELALAGRGLNSFINRNVRKSYERRLR